MSLVLPHAILWGRMPWRRQLVLAAALAVRGDAALSQIQKKVKLRRASIIEALDTLVAEGVIVRDRGKASRIAAERRNGQIISVNAALAASGWTAIAAAAYEHLPTAADRWEALLLASSTRLPEGSGTILRTTCWGCSPALALSPTDSSTYTSGVLTAQTYLVLPVSQPLRPTGADELKLVTRS